ncbi:hypothetical protein [Paenibacillus tuaregi]|uniref:hypothetical protein n=1 Tax=Paenibacillus tuaregi TaxID=1816681 RepID=UPI000B1FDF10|nr:hypothetical protein [Paenibacillus tuaregi]
MGKSRTIRRGGSQRRTAKQQPTAALLRRVAAGMLPFLRAVERSRGYASAWSRAVVKADLDAMRRLLHKVSPRLGNQGLGSNGIGYFISFSAAGAYYSSGTTIPPGSVQFYFNPRVHRLVAKALLPYYCELASKSGYALALARAIRRGTGWRQPGLSAAGFERVH